MAGAVIALPELNLEPDRVFGQRYRIVRKLGSGGMGAVYEVERVTDARHLALKLVTGSLSGAAAARFAREAEIGARLKHPNLVEIVDVGISEVGAPFLVMELVQGGNLGDRSAEFGKAGWGAAGGGRHCSAPRLRRGAPRSQAGQHSARGRASSAAGAHLGLRHLQARVGHRGARPARADRCAVVEPRGCVAHPHWQPDGHAALHATRGGARRQDRRKGTDVFAFGIVAYEVLSGHFPFAAPPVLEVLGGRPAPPLIPLEANIPESVRALVTQCLDNTPVRRSTSRRGGGDQPRHRRRAAAQPGAAPPASAAAPEGRTLLPPCRRLLPLTRPRYAPWRPLTLFALWWDWSRRSPGRRLVVMMTINVAELKAHLSEYLRRARRGERIVVRDRKVPIVELVPVRSSSDPWERLAREKGLRLGSQDRKSIRQVRTRKRVDWAKFLREVQGDTL